MYWRHWGLVVSLQSPVASENKTVEGRAPCPVHEVFLETCNGFSTGGDARRSIVLVLTTDD
jgi:hypothetical protein